MHDLIRELELVYDLVLIDAPPLLPVTDAAVVAASCSGAVLVVRYGSTKREQLQRAVESLHSVGANVYGAVLTMTPTRGPDAYYYGYGYGYRSDREPRRRADLVTPTPRITRSGTEEFPSPTTDELKAGLAVGSGVSPEDPLRFFTS